MDSFGWVYVFVKLERELNEEVVIFPYRGKMKKLTVVVQILMYSQAHESIVV